MSHPPLSTRNLTSSDWPVVEHLFGRNGACGGCWCMYWRVPSTGRYWEARKGEPNRAAFEELVRSGKAKGILGFREDEPIGWCSIGPRRDFAYLARARKIPPSPSVETWSVTCFFVARPARNSGIASRMLEAAVKEAKLSGADYLEGYPSVPAAGRIPDAFAHTGVPRLFESAGFMRSADAGSRLVYRLAL